MQAQISILVAVLGFSSAAALDLTPEHATRSLEGGFTVPILQFTHEGKRVKYRPPNGWEVSGGSAVLTLIPTDIPQAIARIRVIPRTAKTGVVATGDADLEKWILSEFFPNDALEIERVETNESPFMLGQIPSREYVYRYRRSTATFMKSVSVVDLDDKQRVAVEISAGATQFNPVHRAMIRSLFSWEWDE